MIEKIWRIELFGRLSAGKDGEIVTRFRTHKTGLLLAHLAFYPKRIHAREELIEMLWSEFEPNAGRTSLRTALASLRRQLEPPGTPSGSFLIANRSNIQINSDTVTSDVSEFEFAFKTAAQTTNSSEKIDLLARAVELYQGELLPGYYENWIITERGILAENFLDALRRLAAALEQAGEFERAIDYARRRIAADRWREEAHAELMRLYAATGQISAAKRQYDQLKQILRDELNVQPAPETRSLVERLPEIAERTAFARSKKQIPSSTKTPINSSADSVRAAVGHLPIPLTRFVDRETELEQIGAMLSAGQTRILTLTGMGGSGKTRLAIEAARKLFDAFDGAIYFVSLADLRDARLIAKTLLKALNLPRNASGDALEQAARSLPGATGLTPLTAYPR